MTNKSELNTAKIVQPAGFAFSLASGRSATIACITTCVFCDIAMKEITTMLRTTRTALGQYPLFYSLITLFSPVLYLLLLWLDSWGNMPARL